MNKIALGGLGVLGVTAIGIVAAALSSDPNYQVERSIAVKAAPEAVYDRLIDFRQFVEWSPWDKLDPDMTKEFSGSERGKDAVYTWSGNNKVGAGRMTIVDTTENETVQVRLEFLRPFATVCQTAWDVTPEDDGCRVRWSMTGRNDGLMPRVFGLFMKMDKMVGKDFENGLASLKSLSERESS
jgi:carbon monoxide dehydrogenase subunit G